MALTALNSLVTLDEANAYAEDRNWLDWDAADDDEDKAPALIEATAFILNNWRWPTGRYDTATASAWPFAYIDQNLNGVIYRVTGTPDPVKAAVIEAARLRLGPDGKLITGTPLVGGNQASERVLKSREIGPLKKTWETRAAVEVQSARFAQIDALLRATGAIGALYSVNVPLSRA